MTEDEAINSEIDTMQIDTMQIGSINLIGVRTFILALVALIGYILAGYSGMTGEFLSGMKELTMIVFAFFFVKTAMKNS